MIYWPVSVEEFEKSEEMGEPIAIVKVGVHGLELIEDFDEYTHYVTENSDAEKHKKGAHESFTVTSRIKVAKTHGGKCCKSPIHDN